MPNLSKLYNAIKSPNFLTVTRMLVAPFVLFLCTFLPKGVFLFRLISTVLFVTLAVTDLLDGYLARKNRQVSKFGTWLDNIADKILVTLALLGLLATERVNVVPVAIIITREIIVSGLREFAVIQKGISVPTTMLSKAKTTLQAVAISILLISLKGDHLYNIGTGVLLISAALAVVTLFQHLQVAIGGARKQRKS